MKYFILIIALGLSLAVTGQTTTENYIKNTTYQVETATGSVSATEKIETVTYYDGLGRHMQSVGIRAAGNGEDIVVHIDYDDFGRQVKDYLPYATTTDGGLYSADALTSTTYFYDNSTKYEDTTNPYSEKHLGASPLNKVLEQGAPGTDWAVDKDSDTDHTIKFEYLSNTDYDKVRQFSVDLSSGSPQLVDDGDYYLSGQLYKTVTKDENWKPLPPQELPNAQYPNNHTTEEYKDKQGRVVLKRTFDNHKWLDTYYVYDDYGNLTYVLPPKALTLNANENPFDYIYEYEPIPNAYQDGVGDAYYYFSGTNDGFDGYVYLTDFTSGVKLNSGKMADLYYSQIPDMLLGYIMGQDSDGDPAVAATVYIQDGGLYLDATDVGVYSASATQQDYYLNFRIDISNYISNTIDAPTLNGLCYQYRYDDRNRLIEKKIPGKDWEYIIYDNLDRPVLTQDANLRVQDQWLFTKYDIFGRVIYTGLFTSTTETETSLRTRFKNKVTADNYEEKVSSGTGYQNSYYTNANFPDTGLELLTINYYDDYVFDTVGLSLPATNAFSKAVVQGGAKTKGLATGSKVKVLGTTQFITTVTGYDDKDRAIYTASDNPYLGIRDVVQLELDFVGKVLKTRTRHQKGSDSEIVTLDTFTYDHTGRLMDQYQCIGDDTLSNECSDSNLPNTITRNTAITTTENLEATTGIILGDGFGFAGGPDLSFTARIVPGGNGELIAQNHYDELGQLDWKKVGNTTASPLQTVNYAYNIRGWLKQINDPTNLGNDLFTFKLNYNTQEHGAAPLYNGNIAETEWRTANTDTALRWYKYTYDSLNRLLSGLDGAFDFVEVASYDKNGNIASIIRKGFNEDNETYGLIDQLSYAYGTDSNQLIGVTDNAPATNNFKVFGFKDGNTSGNDYGYDANGNMVKDLNKGIVGANDTDGILYNHLNLPSEVKFGGTNKIKYIYDATGVKLEKRVVESGKPDKYTYYAGNYVYEGSSLKFFNHPEGYVEPVNPDNYGSGFNYIYQYKDHLGNIRLSYRDNSGSLEILEENNYYPFGLHHKGYNNVINGNENDFHTYNGKEHDKSLGLNWHDYGARRYDASLGRWMSTDPYAEKYETLSPYTYVSNNPVNAIDPDGRLIIYVNGLLFSQALGHKTIGFSGGKYVGHYAYPPPRNFFYNKEPTMFGQEVKYWGNITSTINKHFDGDDKNIFINATDDFHSQAQDRFAQGQASGLELIENLKNGTIVLENEETIKIVGHSQGAAFAAGMLTALMKSEYASRVEAGIYLSPHQPGDFKHPDGVFGAQFSTKTDAVSSGYGNGNDWKGDLLNLLFNGKSDLSDISGADYIFIRPGHGSSLGGHEVQTWDSILKQIDEFLKKAEDDHDE